jgi:FAD/FMN-containing dehydrogenase/Fe-S oxidoreductase
VLHGDVLTSPASEGVDRNALEADLRTAVGGEVRFDAGSRSLYAVAGSNYRQVPIGLVVPKSVDDVVAAVGVCAERGAPVLPVGGMTSLAGQNVNVAVTIDFSKYLGAIDSIDPEARVAHVQPGLVLDVLRDRAEQHTLTFGPDPSTHTHCTLGGMIGNNSCGVHSVMAGRTSENVVDLDILTYDGLRMTVGETSDEELARVVAEGGRRGEIYAALASLRDRYAGLIRSRFPDIPRRVSGFSLDQLLPEKGFNVARALVGTEGTCATVLGATVRLVHSPPERTLVVLGFRDVFTAADHVMDVMAHGPIGLEGMDDVLVQDMKTKGVHTGDLGLLPDGGGWLLVEFGADSKEESDAKAREMMAALGKADDAPKMKLYEDSKEEDTVWKMREAGLGSTALVPNKPRTWEGWEDAAVPPERLGGYLRDFRQLLDDHHYACSLYGHFGDGCVHTRIDFDFRTADGIRRYRSFVEDAADLVVRYGGSLSGEHGDGQSRAELLPRMFGDELVQAFAEFKAIWDPGNKMNPHKVVEPYRVDENLRLGTDYRPWQPVTFFQFPDDENSFQRATLRCVGIGNCRREGGGTMCPSYMVTREEEHSTRGRARMLHDMLVGDLITDGWRSTEVRQALDLCLACKGCKNDCPVNVDMATYKAEFLAHHYAGRVRPAAHYTMGWLPVAALAAAKAPRAVNGVLHSPGLQALIKRAGGIDRQRSLPRFAPQTFTSWFRSRGGSMGGGPKVLLWPDTFTNHFDPAIGRAAVDVLEDAGFSVIVPDRPVCCGLTWISTGQLKTAKRMLRRTLRMLRDPIEAGVPVVGLEPSCTAVFRSDMHELFPSDQDAARLRKETYTLAEFLQKKAPDWKPPLLQRSAIVQGHCHQKSIMHMDADEQLWSDMSLDADLLDSGCCGLAGNFGFEEGHHEVSVACAERVLMPRVRQASSDSLIVADGFSCRTQIAELSDRRAVHTAEVLQMALKKSEPGMLLKERPERAFA